jgi:hypothetical protein
MAYDENLGTQTFYRKWNVLESMRKSSKRRSTQSKTSKMQYALEEAKEVIVIMMMAAIVVIMTMMMTMVLMIMETIMRSLTKKMRIMRLTILLQLSKGT